MKVNERHGKNMKERGRPRPPVVYAKRDSNEWEQENKLADEGVRAPLEGIRL